MHTFYNVNFTIPNILKIIFNSTVKIQVVSCLFSSRNLKTEYKEHMTGTVWSDESPILRE